MIPPMIPSEDYLTVTDLKNYIHCARFSYYEGCLPDVRPRTYKMDAGEEAHARERERARRRTLKAYGLPEGERLFNVRLVAAGLGLSGELDELVITGAGVYLPVDYKLSTKVNESFEIQVTAYAMLVEDHYHVRVETGYVYLIAPRKMCPVTIDERRRGVVRAGLEAIRQIVQSEQMPRPPNARAKCRDCEFRRFCNDV